MLPAERLPSEAPSPKPLTERPVLRQIHASAVHHGLERSNARVDRLQELFAQQAANDQEGEVVELSEDDLEELQEERTVQAEASDARSEALQQAFEAEQAQAARLADRYTEAMTKLVQAQSELETLGVERSIIGIRRFFDADAKTRFATVEHSTQQATWQLAEANRELRELSPLMQANNQRIDEIEHQKRELESSVESQKRELLDGAANIAIEAQNEQRMGELRAALQANLAASEQLFGEIQEMEKANAPLSEQLAQLFQEQYQLDQERIRLDAQEQSSFIRRAFSFGKNSAEPRRAELERRAKQVQREMAQTLRRVADEGAKLEGGYSKKDALDREFFRLNQEMNDLE